MHVQKLVTKLLVWACIYFCKLSIFTDIDFIWYWIWKSYV